jgi:prepilin-type N-terminal cleavage/methylation domain-containing protein
MNNEQRITNTDMRMRGFTLAEAMMATVVLGIAAAGVLLPFTGGAKVRAEGIRATLAANLASDLMEEIINTTFYDIQDEYPEATVPLYPNFSRGAICEKVNVPISPGTYSTDVEFILVTVKVKYNGREIAVINRLISN